MSETEQVGYTFEHMGVMSHQDYIRYASVGNGVLKTGTIPDADFSWMLALATSPPLTRRPHNTGTLHSLVFDEFRMVKHFTPLQKEKVMQAVLPLTSSADSLDQTEAASLLYTLDDSRAVPYLRPMLNSPNAMARYNAYLALKHLHAL